MPIALPAEFDHVDVPVAPDDPPTLNDVVAAKLYKRQVEAAATFG